MTLQYDRHGRLNTEEIDLQVTCDNNGWVEHAMCYSEVLGRMVDCTDTIRNDNEWNQRIVQDFVNREAAKEVSAAEDHDYFREGRGA